MDKEQLLLCDEKEQDWKLPKQQLDEGKKMTEEELPQNKERSASHAAEQIKHIPTKVRKAPCVMVQVQQQLRMRENASRVTVTVQQQWNREGKVPDVIVEVQQQEQMTEVPCITVQVDQEWESAGEVACVTVKVQQQAADMDEPCDTAQHESPKEDVSYDNVNRQQTRTYADAPCRTQDLQQAQNKEGTVAPEMEPQQQNQETMNVIDAKPLGQGAEDSLVEKSLPQQCRWDENAERLNLVQLVQNDQKENMLEEKSMKTKNPLHAVSQDGTQTTLYHLGVTKENKETTTKQHEEGGTILDQQQLSTEEGAPKVITEEKVKEDRQEQPVSKIHRKEAPNYFVAIPITNDQVGGRCFNNRML